MTCPRFLLAAMLSMSAVSCTFHSADLWYPTVAEADAMDVQWGMEKRKPRGGPKQFYQYKSTDAAAAAMNLPPVSAPAAPTPAPSAPVPAPAVQPDAAAQSRVNSLR